MKKKLCNISAILILALLFSCNGGKKDMSLKLIPVRSGENYQYIDQEGKIIINPQFRVATLFREGLALVQTSGENSKWGFISEEGKYVITANYKSATVFSEGLAWVVSESAAPTAINSKGEIKITLKDAQKVKIFKQDLAAFSIMDSIGEKWGFVDKQGNIKINTQFASTGNFNSGKCAVKNAEGKWGYIDKEGKIVINYQFDMVKEFVNGKAVVALAGKYGLIDESGKYVINPQFSDMTSDVDMFLIRQDGKFGWCDKDGKITINPQFDDASPFLGNDLAAVKSGKSYGYIDKDGKIAINPQFDHALPFNGKLALVTSSNKCGFIDKDGKYVINPQFDDVSFDFVVYMLNGSTQFESVQTEKLPPDTKILTLVSPNFYFGDLPHLTFKDFTTHEESEYESDGNIPAIDEIMNKCGEPERCPSLEGQVYSATLKFKMVKVYDIGEGSDGVVGYQSTYKEAKHWVIVALKKVNK